MNRMSAKPAIPLKIPQLWDFCIVAFLLGNTIIKLRIFKKNKESIIATSVPTEMAKLIYKLAQDEHQTVSELLRETIRRYIQEREKRK